MSNAAAEPARKCPSEHSSGVIAHALPDGSIARRRPEPTFVADTKHAIAARLSDSERLRSRDEADTLLSLKTK